MVLISARFENDRILVEGELFDAQKARFLIEEAVEDIADAIETEARRQAPIGEATPDPRRPPPGRLKEHPIERSKTIGVITGVSSIVSPGAPPAVSVRGARGRFVGAVPAAGAITGDVFAREVITLPETPEHAKWVHDGTGIYGPRNRPIKPRSADNLVFYWRKRWNKVPTVRGQKPNPYLQEAYFIVNRTFVPIRLAHLRAQIRLAT